MNSSQWSLDISSYPDPSSLEYIEGDFIKAVNASFRTQWTIKICTPPPPLAVASYST